MSVEWEKEESSLWSLLEDLWWCCGCGTLIPWLIWGGIIWFGFGGTIPSGIMIFLFVLVVITTIVGVVTIFIALKSRKKRKCPYCGIVMERLEEGEKIVYQCSKCKKTFKDKVVDKPSRKIGKQDYLNLKWLKSQYYDLGKSVQDIANEQGVSMIIIRKLLDKIESASEDLDDKE